MKLTTASPDLAIGLYANGEQFGPVVQRTMGMARQTKGANALAWAVQAHVVACRWQEWDNGDWQEAAPEGEIEDIPYGGYEAQKESSALIRELSATPADWEAVADAADRLDQEVESWFPGMMGFKGHTALSIAYHQ